MTVEIENKPKTLRHGDPDLPQRGWLTSPLKGDIKAYVEKIQDWMSTESTGWAGQLNTSRQEHQNTHEGYGFADHWADYLKNFNAKHGPPENILEISVGPDAALVENHLNTTPNANITVIEENEENVNLATSTLEEKGYDLSRVNFVVGNAANPALYESLPYFDLIATNNLIQHIPVAPTKLQELIGLVKWNPLGSLLTTISNKISPSGHLIIGDLAIQEWDVNPAEGYQDDPEVLELVGKSKLYIKGGQGINGTFPGALQLGWPLSRRTTAFKDASHIVQTISEHSGAKFKLVSDSISSLENKNMSLDDPAAIITAHIPATLVAGIRGGILNSQKAKEAVQNGNLMGKSLSAAEQESILEYLNTTIPQLEKAKQGLTILGILYLLTLQDKRFSGVFPTHHIQNFTKSQ